MSKALNDITSEGLKLAMDLQQNGHHNDATVVLLANILSATLHQVRVTEAIARNLGVDIPD